jgi:xanthine dehydrogenase accessory factor
VLTAVVGSGGKTTYIMQQAKAYRQQGLSVLVTTTCHMYRESGTVQRAGDISARLRTEGYCMAGVPLGTTPGERQKIGPLPQPVLREAMTLADIVLVEADGSRGRPVKFPGPDEPVIPTGTDRIVIIQGQMAIGQTIAQAAHRPELVCRCLGVSPEHLLTAADLERLLLDGYWKPLSARYPNAELSLKKSIVRSGKLVYI